MSGRLGNTAQADMLKLLFQNVSWANVGNAGGILQSTVAGSLYVSLHTADPGAGGGQNTSEAAYTGYARVAVARSSGGWTVTGSSPTTAENAAAVTFPQSSSGPESETWFTVGRDSGTSAGEPMFQGPLGSTLVVNNLITPSFAINALLCTLD
jgi:hypothetical protein